MQMNIKHSYNSTVLLTSEAEANNMALKKKNILLGKIKQRAETKTQLKM